MNRITRYFKKGIRMKPIENIFGFDCVTCKYNRNCYSGNISNQFRYCQKSIGKVENLDKLEKQNKQLKDNWNKLKDFIVKEYYMYLPLEASIRSITILINKMQELERNDKK